MWLEIKRSVNKEPRSCWNKVLPGSKAIHRFIIFYRVEDEVVSPIRLLEEHSRLAGGR